MALSNHEESILERIVVASENHPLLPEFPPDNPRFPATPTIRIDVEGFENVLLKDESHNPTGTHKDRMAWEIAVTYRDFLKAKRAGGVDEPLPSMSIISSGCAAVAIQTQLRKYELPNLKVLIDSNTKESIKAHLEQLGCEVFRADLSRRPFHWREILALTQNPNGFDITSNQALDPTTRFYDWLSYEIVNQNPEYCFIPFGTGNLFENILNITKKEVSSSSHDPRFAGNIEIIRNCHFIGATTSDPKSIADKLYSPHLPFVNFDEQWIRLYQMAGFCGRFSGVHSVRESFFHEARELAEENGISGEPSGLAGLALLLQMKETLPKDKRILVVNTGWNKIFSS